MKSSFATVLVITAALSAFSTIAQAGDSDFTANPQVISSSTLTRDAVRAEYLTAKQNGTLAAQNDRNYAPSSVLAADFSQASKSRAEVIGELTMAHMSPTHADRAL